LKALNLSVCSAVTDAGVIALCRSCPSLQSLDLSITHKAHITNRCLVEGVAAFLVNLTRLNLSHCYGITNNAVERVVNHCPLLISLDLTWCIKLSDIALRAIASGKGAKELRELSVSDCTKVTSAGLAAIGSTCAALEKVVLNYCKKITDIGILALTSGCRRITCLDLNNCILLTDASIGAIGQYCGLIESLKLAFCTLLTDTAAVALALGCPQLRRLGLFMVAGITNEGKRGLVNSCKHLSGQDFTRIRKSLRVLGRFTSQASKKRASSPDALLHKLSRAHIIQRCADIF
jgi:F-box/leucine-rich repeat protein 2/20